MELISALLTDFYQLTMAYGYWRLGMAEREAVFHLFFRRPPYQSQYAICCGLESVIHFLKNWRFTTDEILYLQTLVDAQGKPLFSAEFLDYLSNLRFTADVVAMPEGQIAFAYEPLLRVQGPLIQCQLIETTLVNLIGFASLIATKASKVCRAAQGDPVIEFGLRRAQGLDGGMTASRSAYVGGCESVSNTLAAMRFHLKPRGTMAHSWIMAFANELSAFENFAQVMADNVVLLVDTYNTLQGVQNAIVVGKQLRNQGKDLLGIRLDSGNLEELSKQSRKLLDGAGFNHTKIMASGDLDEHIIAELKQKGAPIDIWGVGTRMITGWEQPALDIAYKLAAIRDEQGGWQYKLKKSDQISKTTNPGILQVRRFFKQENWLADVIYDAELGLKKEWPEADHSQDLLTPIFVQGVQVYQQPSLAEIRAFVLQQCKNMDLRQGDYPVELDPQVQAVKEQLLRKVHEQGPPTS